MAFLARNLLFGQEATSASSAEEEIAPTPLPDTRREPCAREGCEKRATRTLQTRRNPPQSRGGGRKGSYTGDSRSRDERGGGGVRGVTSEAAAPPQPGAPASQRLRRPAPPPSGPRLRPSESATWTRRLPTPPQSGAPAPQSLRYLGRAASRRHRHGEHGLRPGLRRQ